MSPLWSPDGQQLFYLTEENAVMAVAVETKPAFTLGTPKELFRGYFVNGYGEGHPWDIHPDGKRFLMIKPSAATGDESAAEISRKINIVLNWDEELKQRVPID